MWQSLHAEAKSYGFTVLAVALDEAPAARPWIEAAAPDFPCLIDRDHRVAALYNMVNVPQAVWINVDGRMVRPPETAGSTDGFRLRDKTTHVVPDAVIAERARLKSLYFDAVRDWAKHGDASRYVLSASAARARLSLPDARIAEAHVQFRLGHALLDAGQAEEAAAAFATASRLHPDSWAIWRQHAARDARGFATSPEFWARVDALGDKPYYPPADLGA